MAKYWTILRIYYNNVKIRNKYYTVLCKSTCLTYFTQTYDNVSNIYALIANDVRTIKFFKKFST